MKSNLHQLIREVLSGQITLVSESILVPNWPVSYLIKANVWVMCKFSDSSLSLKTSWKIEIVILLPGQLTFVLHLLHSVARPSLRCW